MHPLLQFFDVLNKRTPVRNRLKSLAESGFESYYRRLPILFSFENAECSVCNLLKARLPANLKSYFVEDGELRGLPVIIALYEKCSQSYQGSLNKVISSLFICFDFISVYCRVENPKRTAFQFVLRDNRHKKDLPGLIFFDGHLMQSVSA